MGNKAVTKNDSSRRLFLKKMAYTAPTVVTMTAVASVASAASGGSRINRKDVGGGIW